MPRPNWSRALPQPLVIPKVMTLKTLADVRALIKRHLPQHFRAKPTWRYIAARLEEAARGGDTDFFLAMVVSSIVVLTILFMGFFVRDAPVQIALAKDAIRSLKTDNAKAIEQLNATIADLQSKLDNRDAQRQERTKQQHVHDERVNILATLILQANQIAKDFEEKDDKDAIQTQYRAWERRTLEALSSKFDVSYLSQFGSARGTGLALMGHNYEGGGWYSLLQGIVLDSLSESQETQGLMGSFGDRSCPRKAII